MKNLIVHPIVAALFPVLFLFIHNSEEVEAAQVIRSLVVVLSLTIAAWILVDRLLGNRDKAAIFVTSSLMLVFSFGRVIDLIVIMLCSVGFTDAGNDLLQSKTALLVLTFVWMLLILLLGCLIYLTSFDLHPVSQFLSVFSLALIALVAFNWLNTRQQVIRSDAYQATWDQSLQATEVLNAMKSPTETRPDIFYIILDEYARGDILQQVFGVDNTAFYDHLRQKGFYVADQSTSNYAWTQLSLASSLNSMYLDQLVDQDGNTSTSLAPANMMIEDNLLFRRLQSRGYKIVNFASGFQPTEKAKASVYLSSPQSITGFENELLNTTPIPSLLTLIAARDENDRQRERILFALEHLPDVTQMDGPVFAFAHIISPHPPFIFGRQGEPMHPNRRVVSGAGFEFTTILSEQDYLEGYKNQVTFITLKVQATIDEILSKARRPTIIVVQADHGPGHLLVWPTTEKELYRERHSILDAVYTFDGNYDEWYPSITPVNTFRVILKRYLGEDLQPLQDRNYFSNLDQPYLFTDVTSVVRQGEHDGGDPP